MEWSSSSAVQLDAEPVMLEWLGERCGMPFVNERITLPSGATVQVDGVARVDGQIAAIAEVFARVTKLKAGQKHKLAKDVLKLSLVRSAVAPDARLILLVASSDVAAWLRGKGWIADALDQHGVEVETAEITDELRSSILTAQAQQVMTAPEAVSADA